MFVPEMLQSPGSTYRRHEFLHSVSQVLLSHTPLDNSPFLLSPLIHEIRFKVTDDGHPVICRPITHLDCVANAKFAEGGVADGGVFDHNVVVLFGVGGVFDAVCPLPAAFFAEAFADGHFACWDSRCERRAPIWRVCDTTQAS